MMTLMSVMSRTELTGGTLLRSSDIAIGAGLRSSTAPALRARPLGAGHRRATREDDAEELGDEGTGMAADSAAMSASRSPVGGTTPTAAAGSGRTSTC